ncbi:hypothetical protein BS78_03G391400 [Paspalum vaginatum]|nr:hypothetical protein BS78_03G391400 [Paspalum vaginatum]
MPFGRWIQGPKARRALLKQRHRIPLRKERAAAVLAVATAAAVVAAALVPTVSGAPGEAERCVGRCAGERRACEAAASACASGRGEEGSAGGCQTEYLACIDVC